MLLRWIAGLCVCVSSCFAANLPVTIFPLQHYDQNISDWINAKDTQLDQPLISKHEQRLRLLDYLNHWLSPWNSAHVKKILLEKRPSIFTLERWLLEDFSNRGKNYAALNYGENFQPQSAHWFQAIIANVDLSQLRQLRYHSNHYGITIRNTEVRALPTNAADFYHYTQAGQGYPFDNLQVSILWFASPIYVLAESHDQAWDLILSSSVIGWVHADDVAYANAHFRHVWRKASYKHLLAITHTETTIDDLQHHFQALTYVGTILPEYKSHLFSKEVLIPNVNNHYAELKIGEVKSSDIAEMPLRATPRHFVNIIKTLIGRPYGWGGLYFYNDCSLELKNLFTPFAIWLPRHSSDQEIAGHTNDLSHFTMKQRLHLLHQIGKPFVTLIYIGGHIVDYLGTYTNPYTHHQTLLSYQNVWGLAPPNNSRRAVIGKAVIFPLLTHYKEDPGVFSQADSIYFDVIDLSQWSSSHKHTPLFSLANFAGTS